LFYSAIKFPVFFLIIATLTILNCNRDQKYLNDEARKIDTQIDTLLKELHYTDYTIHVYPHSSLNRSAVSRKVVVEKFDGAGFTPEGPSNDEPNLPPGYLDNDYKKASYYKKEEISNYDEEKRSEITIDYISVLIVFQSIDPGRISQLRDLIKNTILDTTRDDQVNIYPAGEIYLKR